MAEERNIPRIIVVDFIQVAQYVGKAAGAFFPNQEIEPDGWTRGRRLEILRGKASLGAAGVRRRGARPGIAACERNAEGDSARYLPNNSPHLQDDQGVSAGVT